MRFGIDFGTTHTVVAFVDRPQVETSENLAKLQPYGGLTGGAAPSTSGGGGASRSSGKSTDPGTQLQDNSGPPQAMITGSTQLSDRQRDIVTSVAEQLHHLREADLKAQGKSFPEK